MKQRTIKHVIRLLLVLFFLCVSTSYADIILWQVGDADGDRDEYTQNSTYIEDFTYDFGLVSRDTPTDVTYDAPGYLFTSLHPNIDTYTTDVLNVQFELEIAYDELLLNLGRAGAETNGVYLDGRLVSSITGPGEGVWADYSLSLSDVGIGEHTISIAYLGGIPNNGNFIDYIQLENGDPVLDGGTAPVPEPATMMLLGSGLLGIAGFRRKKRKS